MDMRLAMEWIRDNAERFGGDINRISTFGESAGAGMVDAYAYAYTEDPIARGFVLQSATMDGFPPDSNATARATWTAISSTAGCTSSTNDSVAISDCMLGKTTAEIMTAYSTVGSTFNLVADGITGFSRFDDRKSAPGGWLIGNNQNEAGLFRQFQNQTEQYWRDFNDRLYTCADALRVSRAISEGNSAWRYRYFGDFPNLAVSLDPPSGAYHTSEVCHCPNDPT